MERFTKIALTLWACAAIALQARILRSGSALLWPIPIIIVAAAILTRINRRAMTPIFACAYIFPVAVVFLHGLHYPPSAPLWLAAVLGAILPDALREPWRLPPVWRSSLAYAGLIVAISTMLSIWRETNGALLTMLDVGPPMWSGLASPSFNIGWIVHVALILVIGILWFDWLAGRDAFDFDRIVVTPMLVSATLMSVVSIYQMAVDVRFLNPSVYGSLRRATGTMYDANVAGTIAAMWMGGAVLWAAQGRRWRMWAAPIVVIVNGMAVWASGSRTGVLTALLIGVGCGASFAFVAGRVRWRRVTIACAAVAGITAALLVAGSRDQSAPTPAARIWDTLVTHPSPGDLLNFLWSRNGYGTASMMLWRDAPLAGVGTGSFYALVGDLGPQITGGVLPPDNAQNWLRHQIVEFGVLGALGWIVWYFVFAWFVIVPRAGEARLAWVTRGILTAFGVSSSLGMPGQDATVALTFWTMGCWHIRLVGGLPATRPVPRWVWRAATAAIALFVVATLVASKTKWGIDARSRRFDREYSFGLSRPIPSGPDAGFHRVMTHATARVPAQSRWMVLRVRRAADAADRAPLNVVVRDDDQRPVLKARLANSAVAEAFLPVPPDAHHVFFEITARPDGIARFEPFIHDTGLVVSWEFVDSVSGGVRQYSAHRAGDDSR